MGQRALMAPRARLEETDPAASQPRKLSAWFAGFRLSGGDMGLYQTDKPMAAKYDLHNGQVIGEGGHSVSVLKVSARTGGDFAVKTLKRKSGLIDREVQ